MDEVSQEIKALRSELAQLNAHSFIRIHNSTWRLLSLQFLRGLAFGFGSVAGATILVSLAGYALNQMEVVPIIGEWAKQLAAEILNESQNKVQNP
jgi:hypothetical protein